MAKDRLTKPIQTNPKHDTEIEKIQNECDINKCNEFREIWSLRLDYEAKVDLEVDIRNILIFYIKKIITYFSRDLFLCLPKSNQHKEQETRMKIWHVLAIKI